MKSFSRWVQCFTSLIESIISYLSSSVSFGAPPYMLPERSDRGHATGQTHEMALPRRQTLVCLDWVDNFWEFLTLGENGPASRTDFRRLFNYMDNDGETRSTQHKCKCFMIFFFEQLHFSMFKRRELGLRLISALTFLGYLDF